MGTIQFLTHVCRLLSNEPVITKINKYKCLCSIIILKGIVNSYDYNITSNVRFELIEHGYNCCKKEMISKEIMK